MRNAMQPFNTYIVVVTFVPALNVCAGCERAESPSRAVIRKKRGRLKTEPWTHHAEVPATSTRTFQEHRKNKRLQSCVMDFKWKVHAVNADLSLIKFG